jgi:hypothetical protein
MTRYYFNLHNSIGLVEDEEGRECADLETARAEAIRGVRSIIAEDVMKGLIDLCGKIELVNAAGTVVLTIAFAETVRLSLPQDK